MKEIMTATDCSSGKIDFTLHRLQRLRLVSVDHKQKQLLYYATEPNFAWTALVADIVWDVDSSLRPIDDLPTTENSNIEHLRMICDKVKVVAHRLYRPQSAALSHKIREADSVAELSQLICEIISQARQEIVAVSKTPHQSQMASLWAVLTNRIESGVQYRRIVDLQEIIDHGLLIVSRDMQKYGIALYTLEPARIKHKFYIVDSHLLALFHSQQAESEMAKAKVGRVTNHYQIVARYRKHFEKYKEAAIPGPFTLAHMQAAADQLLQEAAAKLQPIELLWLENLINYGKFSTFHVQNRWSKEKLANLEQKAIRAGLARHNVAGDVVPVYPTDAAHLRHTYEMKTFLTPLAHR